VLTRAGALVAVGAAATFAAGRALGATELYVLGAVGASLLALALVWVRRPVPALVLRRQVHPQAPTAGTVARVEIEVANPGSRAAPSLTVVDAVEGTVGAHLVLGPLAPGARAQVGYRLPTARRGRLEVGPLRAEVVDPFGVARRRLPGAGTQTVTILPAIEAIPVGPMGGGRQEPLAGLSTSAMATSGIEDLATLRPYVLGDDLRRVHWPSSAHADDLLVRRDEERWQGHLTVLIDLRRSSMGPDDFERAVSAAASIVHAVAETGDRVRIATTGGWDAAMADARRAEGSLLEHLAEVAQDDGTELTVPPGDPGRRSSALIVLTGPAAATGADRGADRFAPVVVVRFGTAAGARPTPDELPVPAGVRFGEAWSSWWRASVAAATSGASAGR
jgi:uncharacterized protein (DUF58 family)